jgi:translation initiation factor RLI1
LDGFVPTENLRFRKESLSFKVSDQLDAEEVKRMHSYTYPDMTKTLGDFQLTIEVGVASGLALYRCCDVSVWSARAANSQILS